MQINSNSIQQESLVNVCALPNFNQPNFGVYMVSLWPKSINLPNYFLPSTFNLEIRQTLTLPNISAIQ